MNVATATEMLMPKLSDSMEEGTILSWLLAPGAEVAAGDDLLEVETDKANMTVQAEAAGVLEILVEEGETVAVGTPIARHRRGRRRRRGGRAAASEPPTDVHRPSPAAGQPTPRAADVLERRRTRPARRRWPGASPPSTASTSARCAAAGAGGRITKADVRAAAGIESPPSPAPPRAAAAPLPPRPRPPQPQRPTALRQRAPRARAGSSSPPACRRRSPAACRRRRRPCRTSRSRPRCGWTRRSRCGPS